MRQLSSPKIRGSNLVLGILKQYNLLLGSCQDKTKANNVKAQIQRRFNILVYYEWVLPTKSNFWISKYFWMICSKKESFISFPVLSSRQRAEAWLIIFKSKREIWTLESSVSESTEWVSQVFNIFLNVKSRCQDWNTWEQEFGCNRSTSIRGDKNRLKIISLWKWNAMQWAGRPSIEVNVSTLARAVMIQLF